MQEPRREEVPPYGKGEGRGRERRNPAGYVRHANFLQRNSSVPVLKGKGEDGLIVGRRVQGGGGKEG